MVAFLSCGSALSGDRVERSVCEKWAFCKRKTGSRRNGLEARPFCRYRRAIRAIRVVARVLKGLAVETYPLAPIHNRGAMGSSLDGDDELRERVLRRSRRGDGRGHPGRQRPARIPPEGHDLVLPGVGHEDELPRRIDAYLLRRPRG